EAAAAETDPSARLAVGDALRDQIALARRGARDQQVDALADRAGAGRVGRDLLAHHGGEVAVEREQELLHVASGLVVRETIPARSGRIVRAGLERLTSTALCCTRSTQPPIPERFDPRHARQSSSHSWPQ